MPVTLHKMHLYLITRGIKQDTDKFIQDLSAQYFKYNDKVWVQLGMRPLMLWECVFPKKEFPIVYKTVIGTAQPSSFNNTLFYMLRKALRAKSIPDIPDLDKTHFRIVREGAVARYPIGIKEDDEWGENPTTDEGIKGVIDKGDELL